MKILILETDNERWSEYDKKGNLIHYKESSKGYERVNPRLVKEMNNILEYWCEYDKKGNIKCINYSNGDVKLYEYTYHSNGKVKTRKCFSTKEPKQETGDLCLF